MSDELINIKEQLTTVSSLDKDMRVMNTVITTLTQKVYMGSKIII